MIDPPEINKYFKTDIDETELLEILADRLWLAPPEHVHEILGVVMRLLLSRKPDDSNIGVQTAMLFLTETTDRSIEERFSGLTHPQKACLFRFITYLKDNNWEGGFYDVYAPLEVLRPYVEITDG
jgi:hypothetical protein